MHAKYDKTHICLKKSECDMLLYAETLEDCLKSMPQSAISNGKPHYSRKLCSTAQEGEEKESSLKASYCCS